MLTPTQSRKINTTIRKLSKQAQTDLLAAQASTGKLSNGRGVDVGFRNDRSSKLVQRIRFGFRKQWVYVEKGAKRGYGGAKGSTWFDKDGKKKRTRPLSLGKMNTGKSPAKPWFNPEIKAFTQALTNAVASDFANISFDRLKIK